MTLETRIHELCRKAITANDNEVGHVITELKTALREHMRNTRHLLSTYPFSRESREIWNREMAERYADCGETGHQQITTPSGAVWDTLPRI